MINSGEELTACRIGQTAERPARSPVEALGPFRLLPALLVLIGLSILVGCSGNVTTPLEFTGGPLELVSEEQAAKSRCLMIRGDRRSVVASSQGERFVSPWVRIPEGASLDLGYAFFHPKLEPGVEQVISQNAEARFRARLHTTSGGTVTLLDREASSSSIFGWQDACVDLSAVAGEVVRFELETDLTGIEDRDNTKTPEAVWGAPVLMGTPAGDDRHDRLVILISLDTVRADALGGYGYRRRTTPMLDRFSRDAVTYGTCLSPSPWTRPSHMSLLTSLYPQVHGLDRDKKDLCLSRSFHTWAQIFRDAGFWTAAITGGGFVHPNFGFERGFDRFYTRREDFARHCDLTAAWMEKWRGRDLFIFLHTFATHSPYRPYGELNYNGSRRVEHRRSKPPHQTRKTLSAEARRLRRLYDDGLFYADHCLGKLFRTMQRMGRYDDAMIIVLSDHGELFLEHGVFGHATLLYDELLRVPLLVKFPKPSDSAPVPPAGAVIREPVELLDLLPTAVQCCGIATPAVRQFHGRSLLAGARRTDASAGGPGSGRNWIYAETYQGKKARHAIRSGSLCYMLNRTDGIEELYDLSADPGQLHNLAAEARDEDLLAGRATLALAESLRQDGFHLAVGCCGRGAGSVRLGGRLTAGCCIMEVKPNFPEGLGRVTVGPSRQQILFDVHCRDDFPLDIGFVLEDECAGLDLFVESVQPADHPVSLLDGWGDDLDHGSVRGDASRLVLTWDRLPGPGSAGRTRDERVPWIQLYRRPKGEPGETALVTDDQRTQLVQLGYMVEED